MSAIKDQFKKLPSIMVLKLEQKIHIEILCMVKVVDYMKKVTLAEFFIGVEVHPRCIKAPRPKTIDFSQVNSPCSGSLMPFTLTNI